MDEDELDIYGDLGDFEAQENLREATQQLAVLQDRLNQSLAEITRIQAINTVLAKEKHTLSKNTSSLLLTAKNELQRKDREIQNLRREKEDICFRRSQAVQQRAPPAVNAASSTVCVQTDLSFDGSNRIEVQRTGQSQLSFTVSSTTIKNQRQDIGQPQEHHHRNPFAARKHIGAEGDDQIRAPIARYSRSDSTRDTHSRSDEHRDKHDSHSWSDAQRDKHDSHSRAHKRNHDSEHENRPIKRYRLESTEHRPRSVATEHESRKLRDHCRTDSHRITGSYSSERKSHSVSSDQSRSTNKYGDENCRDGAPPSESSRRSRSERKNHSPSSDRHKVSKMALTDRPRDEIKIEENTKDRRDGSKHIQDVKQCENVKKSNEISIDVRKENNALELNGSSELQTIEITDAKRLHVHDSNADIQTQFNLRDNPISEPSKVDMNIKSPSCEEIVAEITATDKMTLPEIINYKNELIKALEETNDVLPARTMPSTENMEITDNPECHVHSPDSTTLHDDPKPSNLAEPPTLPPIANSMPCQTENQPCLPPLPSFHDLFKSNEVTSQIQPIKRPVHSSFESNNITPADCRPNSPMSSIVAVSSTIKSLQIPKMKSSTPKTSELIKTTDDIGGKSTKRISLRRKTMAEEPKPRHNDTPIASEVKLVQTVKPSQLKPNKSTSSTVEQIRTNHKLDVSIAKRKEKSNETTNDATAQLKPTNSTSSRKRSEAEEIKTSHKLKATSSTRKEEANVSTSDVKKTRDIKLTTQKETKSNQRSETMTTKNDKLDNRTNSKPNLSKHKSPLNILLSELDSSSRSKSAFKKSNIDNESLTKCPNKFASKSSVDKIPNVEKRHNEKPHFEVPKEKNVKAKHRNEHSIEQKLANLFGSDTSDGEKSSPAKVSDFGRHPCTEHNSLVDILVDKNPHTDEAAADNDAHSQRSSSFDICETPIASLVEQIFANPAEGACNDATVSDASSTSLRLGGESLEQIDLYLSRRKRRSSSKYRFAHGTASEPNSSTESKTMDTTKFDLGDSHTLVSMDVDIELTEQCVHDARAQSDSIISLFDALETPRKSLAKFEMVQDTGSLFADTNHRQANGSSSSPSLQASDERSKPIRPFTNDVANCSFTLMECFPGGATIVEGVHQSPSNSVELSEMVENKLSADSVEVKKPLEPESVDLLPETNQSPNESIADNNGENPLNTSDGNLLAYQSFAPSHQTASVMDQSFLNMCPTRRSNEDRVPSSHYEDYLNNAKINDLSSLSDLFDNEDLSRGQPKTDAASSTTRKVPASIVASECSAFETTSETSNNEPIAITSTVTPSISTLAISPTRITQHGTPGISFLDKCPSTPITTTKPSPNTSTVVIQSPQLPTSQSNDNSASDRSITSGLTSTNRLSYYVEEDSSKNEVTMFITRKKKKKKLKT